MQRKKQAKQLSPKQRNALEQVAAGRFYPDLVKEDDGYYARWRGLDDNLWVDEWMRECVVTPLTARTDNMVFATLHDAWMAALKSESGKVEWEDEAECAKFAEELKKWRAGADRVKLDFEFDSAALTLSTKMPKGFLEYRELGLATFVCGSLRGLKRKGDRLENRMTQEEAAQFVEQEAAELRGAGYGLKGVEERAEVAVDATVEGLEETKARLKLVVKVDGEPVGIEDVKRLLEQHSTLVFFRNRWILVDVNLLKQALRALEKVDGAEMNKAQAVAFMTGIGRIGDLETKELEAKGWVRGLLNDMRSHGKTLKPPERIEGLKVELRDYQKRGVAWLSFMTENGFGALLADDMGLGKTVQAIGWMLVNLGRSEGPVLVVAPVTLMGNWRKELEKFAPGLKVYVHHGDARFSGAGFADAARKSQVVLTSYALLVRDYSLFAGFRWGGMVLDEAQIIKNANTLVSTAVYKLRPKNRIALTGTPIENSVADLWSIERFLNPGLLGDHKSFTERFVNPIASKVDSAQGKKLKRILEPFVLRRLKADETIAGELGEKREVKEYCELLPGDRGRYENALNEFRFSEKRQGDVLALITELKLICDGEGKLNYLITLLDKIFAAGESALVFTQYAKIGAVIARRLHDRYGRKFPFLHGALSTKSREKEIAKFRDDEAPSAFVLSLKAGGFGLNLTKATHVIHFDRWWNPAVENQATDRAHRIGQDKRVMVHTLITTGTIEEHVDEILERKGSLVNLMSFTGDEFFKLVELS